MFGESGSSMNAARFRSFEKSIARQRAGIASDSTSRFSSRTCSAAATSSRSPGLRSSRATPEKILRRNPNASPNSAFTSSHIRKSPRSASRSASRRAVSISERIAESVSPTVRGRCPFWTVSSAAVNVAIFAGDTSSSRASQRATSPVRRNAENVPYSPFSESERIAESSLPSADFATLSRDGLRRTSSLSGNLFWKAPSSSGYISWSQTASAGKASDGSTDLKKPAMSSASTTAVGAGKMSAERTGAAKYSTGRPHPSNRAASHSSACTSTVTSCFEFSRYLTRAGWASARPGRTISEIPSIRHPSSAAALLAARRDTSPLVFSASKKSPSSFAISRQRSLSRAHSTSCAKIAPSPRTCGIPSRLSAVSSAQRIPRSSGMCGKSDGNPARSAFSSTSARVAISAASDATSPPVPFSNALDMDTHGGKIPPHPASAARFAKASLKRLELCAVGTTTRMWARDFVPDGTVIARPSYPAPPHSQSATSSASFLAGRRYAVRFTARGRLSCCRCRASFRRPTRRPGAHRRQTPRASAPCG